MTAITSRWQALAEQIRGELTSEVSRVRRPAESAHVWRRFWSANPASEVYVRNKEKACQQVGIDSHLHRLGSQTSEQDLLQLIEQLNRDPDVHGILVQLPLPGTSTRSSVLDAIRPLKDVDAFHPENVGRIAKAGRGTCPARPTGSSSCSSLRNPGPRASTSWSSAAATSWASRWP